MQLQKVLFAFSIALLSHAVVHAQIITFPYLESFESVVPPTLPSGWVSSQKTLGTNDFTVTTGTSGSTTKTGVQAVVTTGDKDPKYLISPRFSFANRVVDKIEFWDRRSSSSFAADVVIECSADSVNYTILDGPYRWVGSSSFIQHSISLPDSLSGKRDVWFRWRVVGITSGSGTSTYRIDDISLILKTAYDLTLSYNSIFPKLPTRMDSISTTVNIKSLGLLTSTNFSVHFFNDNNLNGVAEQGEQFYSVYGLTLNSGDSLLCTATHPPLMVGEQRFITVVDLPQDENRTNDTARVTVNVGNVKGDMLVNEIMYAPTADEPEWVELFNASPDSINLKNWKISDSNVLTKSFISQIDVLVPPAAYQVVARDGNFSLYHPAVPFVVANFSALNNTTNDAVIIYDRQGYTIDSVMYAPSWGGQNGRSLERIDIETPSTLMTNWKTSQDSLGSTPGKINSAAKLDYDLAIINSTQTVTVLNGKKITVINVVIKNIGKYSADSVLVRFYADNNRNAITESAELLTTKLLPQSLAAGDTILISETFPQLPSGETNLFIIAEWRHDERLRDNQVTMVTTIEFESGSIVINEIMYDPLNGQNEWIELFNRSNQLVDLKNWTFNDKSTSSGVNSFKISNQSLIVRAGEYVVVAADSSLFKLFSNLLQIDSTIHISILNRSGGFSFNNDGDDIVLTDITGTIIDSVSYSPRWHHPEVIDTRGRSLERINPDINSNDLRNWSTCTNITGGTPGKANSILTTSTQKSTRISISPNPFSPDGDGFEDFCIIHYNLPMMTSTVNIKIYDIKGRLIRTLANRELSGYSGEIIWDGYCDDKQRARIGVYVIFMEASDGLSGRVETAKIVAVVAAKL